MDAEEQREKKRVNLADDPSDRAMVQRDLHDLPLDMQLEILSRLPTTSHTADPGLPPKFRNQVSDSNLCLILSNYNSPVSQQGLHNLPLDVLHKIVSRLPIVSLIHFKTTSHAGSDLIAHPRLPPVFHNRLSDSNPCLILFNHNVNPPSLRKLYFLDGEHWSGRVRNIDPEHWSGRVWKIDPPKHSEVVDNLVGSCNGLLCLSSPTIGGLSESHSLLIYNPFVGDAVRVPPANRFLNQREFFGFGSHPRTGEFKVVRIVWYTTVECPTPDVEEFMAQVFTIGTTEWRTIGATPPELEEVVGQPPGALVEGSLHWVMLVNRIYGIISFDFASEDFKVIPHPISQQIMFDSYSLSVLNGCLSVSMLLETGFFHIWIKKNYHVKEPWEKQFSFCPFFADGLPSYSGKFPEVIFALENGEILLLYGNRILVFFNPVGKRLEKLQISGLPDEFQALPFLPSLFSAKATMNLQF